jgi:serine/threonine-protein kinase
MEYLPGPTLHRLVTRQGPLPPERAVHFLVQICSALREAHAHGLIHRDIKPGNLIVCERGGVPDVIKLLDFGLVQIVRVDAFDGRLTGQGTVVGTPTYLSPEQACGREVLDVRSDIYSVGAVAYYLLTGQPPFVRKSPMELLAAHMLEVPSRPRALRGDIPEDLEAVIVRCLQKNPESRYADVGRLEEALLRCACAHGWTAERAARWWGACQELWEEEAVGA